MRSTLVPAILVTAWLPATARAVEAVAASTCPTHEAVESALRSLLGPSDVDAGAAAARISVRDFGNQYLVSVKGNAREYDDDARDCEARARVAAVFAALILSPSNDRALQPDAEAAPEEGERVRGAVDDRHDRQAALLRQDEPLEVRRLSDRTGVVESMYPTAPTASAPRPRTLT